MGGVSKVLKTITNPKKLIGTLTGSEAQSKMISQQNKAMQEQMRQSSQQALRSSQDMQQQAAQQQKSAEGAMAREQAQRAALENAARAREGDGAAADVDLSINPVETGEDGRRINEREKFMSKRNVKSSGLSL